MLTSGRASHIQATWTENTIGEVGSRKEWCYKNKKAGLSLSEGILGKQTNKQKSTIGTLVSSLLDHSFSGEKFINFGIYKNPLGNLLKIRISGSYPTSKILIPPSQVLFRICPFCKHQIQVAYVPYFDKHRK